MARERSPAREEARRIWIESGGTMTAQEVAESVGAKPEQVRKWKSMDAWKVALEAQKPPRKRGGQPGNQNAAGAGAPLGNRNAETHGAYSTVRLADLQPEQREYIEKLTLDTEQNMLVELQLLIAKETDLQNKIAALEHSADDSLYIDRIVEMRTPKEDTYHVTMQTVIKASAFDRAMKLEAELNKIHGRIIKLLDSIKGYEMECRRVRLEERKYHLAKQKLSGAFEINPETGEIDDELDGDSGVIEENI